MNQKNIGKFISKLRKEKKLTQTDLAEKLGVTDRSVSNWENGKCMPDLSLFKPLCEILDITINELMSGEKLKKEEYQNKLEENIVNTINYTNKKVINKKIGLFIVGLGIFILLTALSIFTTESSWCSIFSLLGTMSTIIGGYLLLYKLDKLKKIIVCFILFILLIFLELILDYTNVKLNNIPPKFSYNIISKNDTVLYKTPFYNVFRINANSKFEYYFIDTKKEFNIDNIKKFPFNKTKSSIDNLIKYETNYLGNNSNTGNLILNLPLSEYGYDFKINSETLELTINYRISTLYLEKYLNKSLIYNSISIFSLIKNAQKITYNFSGSSFVITRNDIEKNYENYNEINKNEKVNIEAFKKYVELKLNDEDYILNTFNLLFKNKY